MSQYADLLSAPRPSPFFPESALPASKAEVKEAILLVAVDRAHKKQLPAKDLDTYRTCFMLLMNARSDAPSTHLNDLMESIKRQGGPSALSNDAIRQTLGEFSSVYGTGGAMSGAAEDGASLVVEFDSAFTARLAQKAAV